MELGLILRGIAIGFSIAAPVGPIGVLCIRRTLAEGRVVGLATGLGAATADAIYGCMAAFGLTAANGSGCVDPKPSAAKTARNDRIVIGFVSVRTNVDA